MKRRSNWTRNRASRWISDSALQHYPCTSRASHEGKEEQSPCFKEGDQHEFRCSSITTEKYTTHDLSLAPLVLRCLHRPGDGSDDCHPRHESGLLQFTERRTCTYCCVGDCQPPHG